MHKNFVCKTLMSRYLTYESQLLMNFSSSKIRGALGVVKILWGIVRFLGVVWILGVVRILGSSQEPGEAVRNLRVVIGLSAVA